MPESKVLTSDSLKIFQEADASPQVYQRLWSVMGRTLQSLNDNQAYILVTDIATIAIAQPATVIEAETGNLVPLALGLASVQGLCPVIITGDQWLCHMSQLAWASQHQRKLVVLCLNTHTHPLRQEVHPSLVPLELALSAGASWLGRGFIGDTPQLSQLISRACQHQGVAFLDILHPNLVPECDHTFAWYRQHIQPVLPAGVQHNKSGAWQLISQWEERISTGELFVAESSSIKRHSKVSVGQKSEPSGTPQSILSALQQRI